MLVLEYRKSFSMVHPGQPVRLVRVAKFTLKEAETMKVPQILEEAERRFKSCKDNLLEVLNSPCD